MQLLVSSNAVVKREERGSSFAAPAPPRHRLPPFSIRGEATAHTSLFPFDPRAKSPSTPRQQSRSYFLYLRGWAHVLTREREGGEGTHVAAALPRQMMAKSVVSVSRCWIDVLALNLADLPTSSRDRAWHCCVGQWAGGEPRPLVSRKCHQCDQEEIPAATRADGTG